MHSMVGGDTDLMEFMHDKYRQFQGVDDYSKYLDQKCQQHQSQIVREIIQRANVVRADVGALEPTFITHFGSLEQFFSDVCKQEGMVSAKGFKQRLMMKLSGFKRVAMATIDRLGVAGPANDFINALRNDGITTLG